MTWRKTVLSLPSVQVQFHNVLFAVAEQRRQNLKGVISMMITIGQTSDDRRKLSKSFNGTSINVTPKNPCDVLAPVFILTWNNSFVNANYLYCPDFGRYYFVDDIVILTGQRAEIHCSVDVLMSYRDQILNLNVNVQRNAAERNKLIYDANYPEEILSTVSVLKFDSAPFGVDGGYNTVLTVIGGANNSKGG